SNWSEFVGGSPDLRVLVDLQIAPALLAALFPPDRMHDTIGLRAGAEWRHELGSAQSLLVRAGAGWEPSPVPDQVLSSSIADNDRVVIAVGGGLLATRLAGLLEHPTSIDLAVEWHALLPQRTVKLDPSLADFSSGGSILHLALGARASF